MRAILGALLLSGIIAVEVNDNPVDARGLMTLGSRLGPARFRRETVAVGAKDRLKVRSLCGRILGRRIAADEPPMTVVQTTLDTLAQRAEQVSGAPPLPCVSLPSTLDKLNGLTGNALVKGFVEGTR